MERPSSQAEHVRGRARAWQGSDGHRELDVAVLEKQERPPVDRQR
jgi:hypothetical protein